MGGRREGKKEEREEREKKEREERRRERESGDFSHRQDKSEESMKHYLIYSHALTNVRTNFRKFSYRSQLRRH